jgi:ATPase subunit of ABC transporter with duplicated ATPase domains
MAKCTEDMGSIDEAVYDNAMRRYSELEERFQAAGGYAAEAEAATIASNLNLKDHILDQPLKTLSGGQRRRIELARILFSDAETMILDEPTNHLDADSVVWLREFLKGYQGGLIVISHDVELVGDTVNRVFYLDANRQVIDIYNMNWKNYQRQRESDEQRRKRPQNVFHRLKAADENSCRKRTHGAPSRVRRARHTHHGSGRRTRPAASSTICATENSVSSSNGRPMSCRPSGKPSRVTTKLECIRIPKAVR